MRLFPVYQRDAFHLESWRKGSYEWACHGFGIPLKFSTYLAYNKPCRPTIITRASLIYCYLTKWRVLH